MTDTDSPTPNEIRAFRAQHANMRERDLADKLNISEAQLIAAYCGEGVVRVDAHPDKIIGAAQTLGEVMALTRNPSCVNEKVGVYDNYRSGAHASMVLTEDIDLRIFPSRWQHAFMVEKETDVGTRRSLQVFDAVVMPFTRFSCVMAPTWPRLTARRQSCVSKISPSRSPSAHASLTRRQRRTSAS